MKCNLCNIEILTKRGLSYHLSITHKIKYKDYYDKFLKGVGEGICKTCGKETKFHNSNYQQYCCKKCVSQNKELNKIKQIKSKQTCLQKYGTEYNSQYIGHKEKVKKWWSEKSNKEKIRLIINHRKETSLLRYGVDNPAKNEDIKNKFITTWNNRSDEIKQLKNNRTKSTCLKKYGVDNVRKSESVIRKIKNTKLKKYGKLCLVNNLPFSKSSQKFFKLICKLNIDILSNYQYHDSGGEFSLQTASGNRFYYDFVDHNLKRIIEFHGQAFHPTINLLDEDIGWNIYKKYLTAGEARKKENEKYQLAKANGYDMFVIWDFEINNNLELSLIKVSNFLKGIK